MRAGLLSEQSVIDLINENFVSTWVLIDELKKIREEQNLFGETLAKNWEYPIDIMFLSSDGKFRTKLNSIKHIPAHKDVGHPGHPFPADAPTHVDVFFEHALSFLGKN